LLFATILHTLAGAVTGSIFKIQTILALLCLVVIESIIFSFFQGGTAALWAFANVIGIEFGYLVGLFARGYVEHVAESRANARTRRTP
jgi:hypothetical protein